MGGDCCGGPPADAAAASSKPAPSPAVVAAAAAIAALKVADEAGKKAGEHAGAGADGAAPPAAKSHADHVASMQAYIAKRISLFEQYHAREAEKLEAAKAVAAPITVTLPDGKAQPGTAGVSTPMDIAKALSPSLAKATVVAKVDGADWDLMRPLERDCKLELFPFDSPEGKHCFWHSSAHVLGEALEATFGVQLTIGPPVEEGFYYDCYTAGRALGEPDFGALDAAVSRIAKEKQAFQRAVVSRDEAASLFSENPFKQEIIGGLAADATISVYRCGPMVDLCTGPHLPNTGYLKAAKVTAASSAFWRGDAANPALQRVYGVTFPDKAALAEYEHRVAEARKRDHRVVGTAQDLIAFHPLSPGSAFFMPAGARIYNALIAYIRDLYWRHEFEEVVTPNLYSMALWDKSGHAAHYKDNMFCLDVEKAEWGLKPMNCPGHCLLFAARGRSYRDLPIRMADFGVLHRNEFSGALSGLTRVRRFQQDDAHIFCRADQVGAEVGMCLAMMGEVYGVFGLEYEMALSTRPEKFLGEPAVWDDAEGALRSALDATGRPWALNPGDGAFYGPKIDITVFDALRRKFQCATIQLDFQLPIRFNLDYATEDGAARPVIVHRAILGSVERMFAILVEHYAGKWPLWLSPRQAMVVPISAGSVEYAKEVRAALRGAGFHAEVDIADKKMQKKVREAQLAQFNYILVVGEAEREARTVNVRTRDNAVHGMHALGDVIAVMRREVEGKSLTGLFDEEGEKVEKKGGEGGGGGEAGAAE